MPTPIIMPLAEVADRYTISRLKLERTTGDLTMLQKQVDYYWAGLPVDDPALMGVVARLQEINGLLWDQEDLIHRDGASDEEVARRARSIRSLNLQRIDIKNRIVAYCNDGFRDDKQYLTRSAASVPSQPAPSPPSG